MKYFFDTEFIEDGKTIDLLSIGIVAEDGREFYVKNGSADFTKADGWVRENVYPSLGVDLQSNGFAYLTPGSDTGRLPESGWIDRRFIGPKILAFIGHDKPEFWAYYADYDWVVLCQLFGRMIDLPKGWPMYCNDLKQLAVSFGDPKLPPQTSTEHHALNDARWTKQAYEFLTKRTTDHVV